MRRTHATIQVALAMMDNPSGDHYGYELSNASGVRSGVLYPILTRMLAEELVTDHWEDEAEAQKRKRPPRRYYRLNGKGERVLKELLDSARQDDRFKQTVLDRLRRGVAWQ